MLWNLGGVGVFCLRNDHQQNSNTRSADTFNRSNTLLLATNCLPIRFFANIGKR